MPLNYRRDRIEPTRTQTPDRATRVRNRAGGWRPTFDAGRKLANKDRQQNGELAMRMRGLTKDERETLEREWGGIPVVDAPENLRLFVSKEDIESATRKDASC